MGSCIAAHVIKRAVKKDCKNATTSLNCNLSSIPTTAVPNTTAKLLVWPADKRNNTSLLYSPSLYRFSAHPVSAHCPETVESRANLSVRASAGQEQRL